MMSRRARPATGWQRVLAPVMLAVILALHVGAAAAGTALVITEHGSHAFTVELAETAEDRARGLMHRRELDPAAGMLFDFKTEQPVHFWMKNTYVPLDMIFIRADGTVAAIAEDTVPHSTTVVPSLEPVRFVLEVVAGTARRIGLRPGDRVVHALIGG